MYFLAFLPCSSAKRTRALSSHFCCSHFLLAFFVLPFLSHFFGYTSLVTLLWSHFFGHTSLVTLLWSHFFGHTSLVTLLWSHFFGHTSLVTLLWSHFFGHTSLVILLWSYFLGTTSWVPLLGYHFLGTTSWVLLLWLHFWLHFWWATSIFSHFFVRIFLCPTAPPFSFLSGVMHTYQLQVQPSCQTKEERLLISFLRSTQNKKTCDAWKTNLTNGTRGTLENTNIVELWGDTTIEFEVRVCCLKVFCCFSARLNFFFYF